MCVPADAGISLIAHAPVAALPPSPSPAAVHRLLGFLANRTHLVLVAGFPDPEMQLEIMQQADARVLLYEPTLSSLSAAVRSLALLGAKHTRDPWCSALQEHPGATLSAAHVRYAIADRRPDVVIPFDPALHAAAVGEKSGGPGRAYHSAVRQVMEHVVDTAALPQGDEA